MPTIRGFRLFAQNIHKHNRPWEEAPAWAVELRQLMGHLEHLPRNIKEIVMAAIDDLKAAIADLKTQLDKNNAEIEDLLQKIEAPSSTDADITAATQQIRDIIAANQAEVDKATTTTSNPPPTPTPTPTP